jgi:hypothetical protein
MNCWSALSRASISDISAEWSSTPPLLFILPLGLPAEVLVGVLVRSLPELPVTLFLWFLMSGDPLRLPLPLVGGLGSRSERDGRRQTDPRDDAGQEPREEQPERLPIYVS